MSGIGDQTLDTTKGLEALPSVVTIDSMTSSLKMTFVNLCKPLNLKNPQFVWGYGLGAIKLLGWGKPSNSSHS